MIGLQPVNISQMELQLGQVQVVRPGLPQPLLKLDPSQHIQDQFQATLITDKLLLQS